MIRLIHNLAMKVNWIQISACHFNCTEDLHSNKKQCHVPVDVSGSRNTNAVEKYVSCLVYQKSVHGNSLMRHMCLHCETAVCLQRLQNVIY